MWFKCYVNLQKGTSQAIACMQNTQVNKNDHNVIIKPIPMRMFCFHFLHLKRFFLQNEMFWQLLQERCFKGLTKFKTFEDEFMFNMSPCALAKLNILNCGAMKLIF